MSNVKFHNNKYQRLRYNLKDFIINERKPNYSIEKESISLFIPKRYNLLYNY